MNNRRRTRNFFPEPRFQLKFLGFLFFGSLIQAAILGGVLYYFLSQNYEILVKYTGAPVEIQDILFRELRWFLVVAGASFCAYLLGILGIGILFSHRVAGPIAALKRTIRMIREGKEAELHLRDGDEFRDLVESFNQMVRDLRIRQAS